jgi:predicted small lipoprotein YifL
MRTIMRTITALTLLLAFTGCGDDDGPTPPVDSGTDTGMTMPDSGPDPDPDGGTDAGPVDPMPRGAGNPPALGAQIDRMGRPAINTALNNPFNGDATARNAAKDAYNSDDDPSTWAATWSDDFRTSLAILDSLDTVCGNQLGADGADERYAFLAGVLADDQLYVNTASGMCGTYLGYEAEVLEIVEAGGCGGRTPNDDVIDRSYSVLAAGILTGVDDTITEDDAEHDPNVFPFLAAPTE